MSVVDLANKALDKLGYGAITSLDDGTKAANLADRTWPFVRDEVLRAHPWNFAVKRTTTAPESTAPAWGFTYQHPVPADFLRLVEILDLSTNDYQVENNKILCDETVLYLRYIYQVTDPNKYDTMFVDAVTTRFAYEMCETLTQSTSKKETLLAQYEESLRKAKVIDSLENPPSLFEEDLWIEVRY